MDRYSHYFSDDDKDRDPVLMQEAVERVIGQLPEKDLCEIAALEEGELPVLHFGLGMWIRNELDLWNNEKLLRSCGTFCVDDASERIIEEVWRRVRR